MKLYGNIVGRFWSVYPLIMIIIICGSFIVVLALVIDEVKENRILRVDSADTDRVLSAARAYAGMHCADPPAGPVDLAVVLDELGWQGHTRDPEPWSVRLIDGPESCTGAHVLYTGEIDRTLRKALRRKCARWNAAGAELLIRPTVITIGREGYQLRWDDNITC